MMAAHYDVGIWPARPRKPTDKAKVEAGVRLRLRRIFSVACAIIVSFHLMNVTSLFAPRFRT